MTIYHLGLIGHPLSHSLSPRIQKAALKASGLEGEYSLYPIPPEDTQGLKDLLARVRSSEITGLNVTIPHKQNVILLLDELTPTAKAIGAVNVIYRRNQKLVGDNTDAQGFLTDLKRFIRDRESLIDKSALVLGAGGSARAVVYALLCDGWKVTVAARRIEQARQLARSFKNYQLPVTDFDSPILRAASLWDQVSNISLLVNTTPIGMTPDIDQSPLPQDISIPNGTIIYDLVYNPRETKLVRDARAQGLQATTGLGMLIEQAALGFTLWTGHNPPREAMMTAVEQSPISSL